MSEEQRATMIALLEDALNRLKAGDDIEFSVAPSTENHEPGGPVAWSDTGSSGPPF
jgi:hypothetical protein